MKGVFHITFWYNRTRLPYLNKVIDNLLKIKSDIFVHTNNKDLKLDNKVNIIHHEVEHKKEYFLTWKHRDILKSQVGKYYFYCYLEDDMLFTLDHFDYWKQYSDLCCRNNYYLGFIRVESYENEWFCIDTQFKFDKKIKLNEIDFYTSDILPTKYSGFWILNNIEMIKYSQQDFFDLNNSHLWKTNGYTNCRATVAYGPIEMYKDFIVPNDDRMFIHHLSDNYSNLKEFRKIKKEDLLVKN